MPAPRSQIVDCPTLNCGRWCGRHSRLAGVLRSHFSLENVKEFLQANDLSKVQEIWLLHLSDGNSDAERFKREIQELTGKVVYIA